MSNNSPLNYFLPACLSQWTRKQPINQFQILLVKEHWKIGGLYPQRMIYKKHRLSTNNPHWSLLCIATQPMIECLGIARENQIRLYQSTLSPLVLIYETQTIEPYLHPLKESNTACFDCSLSPQTSQASKLINFLASSLSFRIVVHPQEQFWGIFIVQKHFPFKLHIEMPNVLHNRCSIPIWNSFQTFSQEILTPPLPSSFPYKTNCLGSYQLRHTKLIYWEI